MSRRHARPQQVGVGGAIEPVEVVVFWRDVVEKIIVHRHRLSGCHFSIGCRFRRVEIHVSVFFSNGDLPLLS